MKIKTKNEIEKTGGGEGTRTPVRSSKPHGFYTVSRFSLYDQGLKNRQKTLDRLAIHNLSTEAANPLLLTELRQCVEPVS